MNIYNIERGAIMLKIHLKNLYDCINTIAAKHESEGVDRSEWFYTEKEFEDLKQNTENRIL